MTCRPAAVVLVDDDGGDVDVEHLTLSSVVDGVRPDMLRTIDVDGAGVANVSLGIWMMVAVARCGEDRS